MRVKKTLKNLLSNLISLAVPSLLGLIITNLIIQKFGSDINGVIGTINQLLSFLILIEGGITLAIVVALYRPVSEGDYTTVNKILKYSKEKFWKIGVRFFFSLLVISFFLPLLINSNANYWLIVVLLLISGLNTTLSLAFESPYRVLFQASHTDYIISNIVTITTVLGQISAIFALVYTDNILLIRLLLIIPMLFRVFILAYFFNKKFSLANFNVKYNEKIVTGTKDIVYQKIADMVFLSSPVIILSIFGSVIMASVYSVYNSIFILIRSVIYSFVSAPFNGIGLLMSEGKKEYAFKIFKMYESLIIVLSNILFSTMAILILPFMSLYTSNFNDANYINFSLVILFVINGLLEILHIPSRAIININGDFSFLKRLTFYSAILNVIVSIVMVMALGITGVLLGSIIGYLVIVPFTVYKNYRTIFKESFSSYINLSLRNLLFSGLVIFFGVSIVNKFSSYVSFLIGAIIVLLIVSLSFLLINLLLDFKLFKTIFYTLFKKRKEL